MGNGDGGKTIGVGASLPVMVFILTKMLSQPGRPAMKVTLYSESSDNEQ